MITIKKAASLTGLSVKAIRHYESCGLLPEPERTGAGYRVYSESDIARLQQIRYFREMKFPLTEISALLDAPTEEIQKAMVRQQIEVDRALEEYKRAQVLLQSVLSEDMNSASPLSSAIKTFSTIFFLFITKYSIAEIMQSKITVLHPVRIIVDTSIKIATYKTEFTQIFFFLCIK